jgi:hypothetical protein
VLKIGHDFEDAALLADSVETEGRRFLLSQDAGLLAVSAGQGILEVWDITQRRLCVAFGVVVDMAIFGSTALSLTAASHAAH